MPGELRALRRRHGLARTGSSATDPAHTLSARVPAPARTLASVTTQGRCGGEQQQQGVTVGVVVGDGCLKRLGCASSGGGSDVDKKVSFASEPQVRVMSPPAVVEATGRRRIRGTLSTAEVVGGCSTAPVRRSMRIAAKLRVGVEQVTVAVCNSAKFEEGGDAGETVDRKRKRNSKQNSEHMSVSTQIGVSRRSTRSSGLVPEAPFVPPPVVENNRARSKGPDVKEQTLEEQPARVQDPGSTLSSEFVAIGDASRTTAQSRRNRRKVQEDEPTVQKPANEETSGRTSGLLLNNNTSSERSNRTRAREEGNEVKIACLSMHNATNYDIEEDMSKKDGHLELSWDGGAKDCDGTEEQMVQTVLRKGCLKRSGANGSSMSSGVAKKVTFKLVGQPAAEVAGLKGRPRVAADGEVDAGEAGSTAPLRWSKRNAGNVGVGDGVKRIAGAVSRKISAKALEEEEDVGEAVDRKAKARENVEDIGAPITSSLRPFH